MSGQAGQGWREGGGGRRWHHAHSYPSAWVTTNLDPLFCPQSRIFFSSCFSSIHLPLPAPFSSLPSACFVFPTSFLLPGVFLIPKPVFFSQTFPLLVHLCLFLTFYLSGCLALFFDFLVWFFSETFFHCFLLCFSLSLSLAFCLFFFFCLSIFPLVYLYVRICSVFVPDSPSFGSHCSFTWN